MISVTNVDNNQKMLSIPTDKQARSKNSSRSSSRHSWVHGSSSPRSCHSGNSSSKAAGAQTSKSATSTQFLAVPPQPQQDAYTTPKSKDICMTDRSNTKSAARVQKALQAPKKRDEFFGEVSSRKNRAYDYENLSICEFRLGSSPSSKGSDCHSTQNSSNEGNPRQEALDEMRSQW